MRQRCRLQKVKVGLGGFIFFGEMVFGNKKLKKLHKTKKVVPMIRHKNSMEKIGCRSFQKNDGDLGKPRVKLDVSRHYFLGLVADRNIGRSANWHLFSLCHGHVWSRSTCSLF